MRCRLLLLIVFLLASCREEQSDGPRITAGLAFACDERTFEGSRFHICSADGGSIEIRTSGPGGIPFRSFAELEAALGDKAQAVKFAMNGGMFDEDGRAIGLSIEDGREIHPINLRNGLGNFHMRPNGVFLVRRDGLAEVVASEDFRPAHNIMFATQSGPMLVIDGQIHPRFEADGSSRYVRNGVGVDEADKALFAISQQEVSFGKLARLFRDELRVRNALYLDGSVSSLWDPAAGRRDRHAPIGPMIVVFKPLESKRRP